LKKAIIIFSIIIFFVGCYSFTGGSVPEHLETLYIAPVEDVSGFGDPQFRILLNEEMIRNFEDDASFVLVNRNGDARIEAVIKRIVEEPVELSPGELETERKITVSIEVAYNDLVKKKLIWEKSFSNFEVFEIANAQTARNEALGVAIEQTALDILFAVVSGW
jgi:hypothetical protein